MSQRSELPGIRTDTHDIITELRLIDPLLDCG